MKMLLIVDPQVDFVDGALPVCGAQDAMASLAAYMIDNNDEYVCKVVTADWHPYRHCSFAACGGEWPVHCVANTVGAAIYPLLVAPLYGSLGETRVLYKGMQPDREEYSIFANEEAADEIKRMVEEYDIDHIDICGLAGDICVLNTLSDGISIFGPERFRVLTRFAPSLDGGVALNRFISLNHIKCDR